MISKDTRFVPVYFAYYTPDVFILFPVPQVFAIIQRKNNKYQGTDLFGPPRYIHHILFMITYLYYFVNLRVAKLIKNAVVATPFNSENVVGE